MKKVFLASVLAMFALCAQAQDDFTAGVEVGLNICKPSRAKTADNVEATYNRQGFAVGAFGEYAFLEGLMVRLGVKLESRPYRANRLYMPKEAMGIRLFVEDKTTPYYLSVPLQLGYRFRLSDDVALSIAAGPSVSFGLFGKTNLSYEAVDESVGISEKCNCFGGEWGMKRFDWGITGRIAVEFMEHFFVAGNYYRSFKNVGYLDMKYNVFNVSLGYIF